MFFKNYYIIILIILYISRKKLLNRAKTLKFQGLRQKNSRIEKCFCGLKRHVKCIQNTESEYEEYIRRGVGDAKSVGVKHKMWSKTTPKYENTIKLSTGNQSYPQVIIGNKAKK